jgi:hypothetical protein
MRCIEHGLDLFVCTAFDDIKFKHGHLLLQSRKIKSAAVPATASTNQSMDSVYMRNRHEESTELANTA